MNYTSARNLSASVSASQAIISGISAGDGGLFVPETLPFFDIDEIEAMTRLEYPERVASVLSKFLPEFSYDELLSYASKAYCFDSFPVKNAAPVKDIGDGINVLELFHGPTCAFKDFALQLLPFLLAASLRKNGENKTAVILTATSGDTGKAALDGFADVDGVKICVFYPHGGTSNMQRLQMATQKGDNVNVIAVHGNFDDAQSGVKKIFTDAEFAEELNEKGYFFSSANSINWGRLVPQIAYYFSAYCELRKNNTIARGEKFNVTVPTGNFGNLLAAYYAKCCGLPVGKLICASNSNNVLTDFISTGTYDRNREFRLTTSPSMDILISSNLERLLFELSGHNDVLIKSYMDSLAKTGKYTVSEEIFSKVSEMFYSGYADDEETADTIDLFFKEKGYLCDTHTAVALKVYGEYRKSTGDTTPCIIASTASPFKFASSVLSALGQEVPADDFDALDALSSVSANDIPSALAELKTLPVRFDKVIDPADMKKTIREWLLR